MKKYAQHCFVFLFAAVIFFSSAHAARAGTSVTLLPTSGSDATATDVMALSASDITKLSASDDSRVQSNGTWPVGAYDESKYLEYVFSPNIPQNATIESARVDYEFRRTGSLSEAKLEIGDGGQFVDRRLTTGSINVDHTDTVDILPLATTPAKANALTMRFLAYRISAGDTQTSHDLASVTITYTTPTENDSSDSTSTPPPNTPPVTVDASASTTVETPVSITVSASDAEHEPLTYTIVTNSRKGTLGAFVGNRIVYSPTGQTGTDMFTFKANDGTSDSNISTVSITLTSGVLTRIVLTVHPSVLTVGEYADLTASGFDQFGNPVSDGVSSPVRFYSFQGPSLNYPDGNNAALFTNGVAHLQATATTSGTVEFITAADNLNYSQTGHATGVFVPIPVNPDGGGTTVHLPVTAGTATVDHTPLTDRDMINLGLNDNFLLSSIPGSATGDYNENKYLEFDFSTSRIPENAVPDAVFFTHKYRSSSQISGAKFEIWNGETFVDLPSLVPSTPAVDVTQMTDITPYITTADRAAHIIIRFLAFSDSDFSTAHDLAGINLTYHTSGTTAVITQAPTVSGKAISTPVDSLQVISLEGHDPQNHSLTFSVIDPPTHGTLGTISGNRVTYTPTGTIGDDSFTFTASNGVFTSSPATVGLTLTPGVINKLQLTADPVTAVVGETITLTATAQDIFGNTVTNDNSTDVNFSSDNFGSVTDTTKTLSAGVATTTATANSEGMADFNATITQSIEGRVTIPFLAQSTTVSTESTTITTTTNTNSNSNSDSGSGTNGTTDTTRTEHTTSNSGGGGGGSSGFAATLQVSSPIVAQKEQTTSAEKTDTASPAPAIESEEPTLLKDSSLSVPPAEEAVDDAPIPELAAAAGDAVPGKSPLVKEIGFLGAGILAGIWGTSFLARPRLKKDALPSNVEHPEEI